MPPRVTLTTSDGIEIVGVYRHTDQDRLAILLHMMPATKESWDAIAEKLLERGYASFAFDQRGHGESTMGGTLDYKTFTPAQQQAKRLDLEAALDWAHARGFDDASIVLIGASIGLAGAVMLTRVMRTLLFNVNPLDPAAFAAAVIGLAAVVLLACWFPAQRARRIHPMEALRRE